MLLSLGLIVTLAATQSQAPGTRCGEPHLAPAARESCLGDEATNAALSLPPDALARREYLEVAARHYRRASDISTGTVRVKALEALAATYGPDRLNATDDREAVLRELIAAVPDNPKYAFDLAASQESAGFPEIAEDTLLAVRQQHPDKAEVFRRLAQFYSRRIAALERRQTDSAAREPVSPGERERDGVYRIGGQLSPPPREGTPQYPVGAQDAQIEGAVEAEIVIDERGQVADAQVVKSVPLLDDAALEAVRKWRYEPTIVDGKPVPVRMVVTVRFTLSK